MSFLRGLFEGVVDTHPLVPYPRPGEEETSSTELVLDAFRKLAAGAIDPAAIDRDQRIPEEVLAELREMGLFGLIVPEEHGGLGLGATAYARVLEEVASVCVSTAVTIGAHQSIGLKALLLFGSDAQKARWLPELASGERIAGFALTEPSAGSDAGGIRTTAAPRGSGWTLNGSKQWITNGGIGRLFTVFAKAPLVVKGEERSVVTAFLVPRESRGLTSGTEEHKLGIRGSSTTALFLEDVEVGEDDLLGEIGKGFKVAMEVLNEGRIGLAAGSVGAMKRLLAESSRYAGERRQFGRPIATFDMIREKLARIALDTYAAESMVYLTTGRIDAGERDFSLESAACKVFASEACWRAADAALQIAGGYGYMCEFPYERHLRDARINPVFEGANEILRLYIAASGLRGPGEVLKEVGGALKHPFSSIGVLSDFAARSIRRKVLGLRLEGLAAPLTEEAATFGELATRLAETGEQALRQHRKDILERQLVVARLANASIELYAIASVLARASQAVTDGGEDGAKDDLLFARAFVADAVRRVRRELRAAQSSDADDAIRAVAQLSLEAGGYPIR